MSLLLVAAPALAMVDGKALDGTLPNGGPVVPEPSAALLFAAGAGFVAWTVRRRPRR